MAKSKVERWHSIPDQGQIAEVLRDRFDWLEAIAAGKAGARRKALGDLADDGRTEDRIRQGYTGRAAIELLQNAHDAMAEVGMSGSVRFVATDEALLVANEGQPFDARRVASICRLGSSDKVAGRDSHHQIGYKGIGFTSVFELSDRPQVLSQEVGFKFDRLEAADLIRASLGELPDGPVPARYFPLAIRDAEIAPDHEAITSLFRSGAVTVIRLPFRHDLQRAAVIDSLVGSLVPEMLLFMPTIRTLTFRDGAHEIGWTQRPASRAGEGGLGRLVHIDATDGSRQSWLLATGAVPIERKLIDALNDTLWSGITQLNVAAALPWGPGGPRADPVPSRLHSYFPTDDILGRGLLLHADFYLDSTRQRIAVRGPGRDVSRVAADGVATLAARLVESVAKRGAAVLEACVERGRPDGAGEMVGKRLEAALQTHSVARRFRGGTARPGELVRLGLDLPATQVRRFASILDPVTDLLNPEDDQGQVRGLLLALGSIRLDPSDVAERIDMRRWREGYAAGLALLGEWLTTTGWLRTTILRSLASRRVVQDEHGAWVQPTEVERRGASAPDLPLALRRELVKEPGTETAKTFLDSLAIPKLDARSALGRLLDALEMGEFGRDEAEKEAALDLSFRVWRTAPDAFRTEEARIGSIEIRCRSANLRDPEPQWLQARDAYFGRDWLGDPVLEDLYGPDGFSEFVAEGVSAKPTERLRRRAFLEAIGVQSAPRELSFGWALAEHRWEWQEALLDDPWICDMGHVNKFVTTGKVIERLDQILDRIEQRATADALAHALAMLADPYGPSVSVRCGASQHKGIAPIRSAVGYQRWRLSTVAWVPVTGDPAGAVLQIPSNAWRSLPRGSRLMVPRAKVRAEDAERLELVSADKPPLEAIEGALNQLQEAHPDLATAPPEVHDTAIFLMQRLERTVARGERPHREAPSLLANGVSGPAWSTSPVVANVPGMPRIPTLDILPRGTWPGLQRTYGLMMARDLVSTRVIAGAQRITDFILPHSIRGNLLALLLRRGIDPDRTASRLSALVERPVANLRVMWRHGQSEVEQVDATFVLDLRRDSRSHLIGAQLVWVASLRPDLIALGTAIAEYLDLPEFEGDVSLFLTAPSRVAELRGVTSGELEDADRLLRQRRAYAAREEPDWPNPRETSADTDDRLNPEHWTPPIEDAVGVVEPERPMKEYPDLRSARLGPSRRIEPMGHGARERSPRDKARPGEPASSLSRPLPPPSDEERAATASGRRTELTAIELVTRIGRGLPDVHQVVDVQDQNRGWDLEFHMRDGAVIPVEVKGSAGSAPFVITANEWSAAREHPTFVLYHVVDITTPGRMRVRLFRNLGTRLREELVSSAGWAVTGWRELEPEEMDIEL